MGINFRKVSYTHARRSPMAHKALDDITFTIPNGQFVAIMGPSGSGKSTLGQLAAGLLQPDSGTIDQDAIHLNNRRNRNKLLNKAAYISQYPEHHLIEETVFKDIRYGLRRMKFNEHEISIKVKEAMEHVGLSFENYRDRSPFLLSGGEKKRVILAGALILEPNILILDEPTVGLDPLTRVKLLTLLTTLQRTRGMTIVIITHHLQEALEYAERLLILSEGQLKYDIKIADIQSFLEHSDFPLCPTPLLCIKRELESYFPGRIDPGLVQESKLLSFITERLMRT